jgi:hypothetical protein
MKKLKKRDFGLNKRKDGKYKSRISQEKTVNKLFGRKVFQIDMIFCSDHFNDGTK